MPKNRVFLGLGTVVTVAIGGCQLADKKPEFRPGSSSSMVVSNVPQLEQSVPIETGNMSVYGESSAPFDLDESSLTADRFRSLTLQECISEGLQSSRVMRDLGVSIIRSPQGVNTNYDPALAYTDPRQGEEAALSAFDANFFASSIYEANDRGMNNQFFGSNGNFMQDLSTSQFGLNKRSATGGLYSFRSVSVYDKNNQVSNRFVPFSWDSFIEAQMRQPLLQGAGTQFNRIAGPGAAAGQLNGVLLARVRTDISMVDLERSVREYVSDIENAYWDLYYAYRDLEARVDARDIAVETFNSLDSSDSGIGKKAQAEEQVHRFQSEIVDSLNGRPIDGTRTHNGSTGGTFRGSGGIRICERRLRWMMGLPINDGVLLRPTDRPSLTPVQFDWDSAVAEALTNREEIRRQRWVVKQRELELIANRNFLKPQLDLISQYRMRGFNQELTGSNSALDSMWGGQFQEWQLGLEYQMPVGFRRGNAAVKSSQLSLVREAEVLKELSRSIHLGLSNAVNETKRAYDNLSLQEKRLNNIVDQLNAIAAKNDKGGEKADLDVRLETHRRLLDARLRYHQSEVEYMLALRNVNVERGTLLRYCNVWLNEQSSRDMAVQEAVQRVNLQDYKAEKVTNDIIVGRSMR